MQRLRNLKQLGTSEITYVNTNHTRFEHSLGVMKLGEDLVRDIYRRQPKLWTTENDLEKDVVCVKLAGLLHDIGHGPYSHVYDGLFRKQLRQAEEAGHWLGRKFDVSAHKDLPKAMDGWAHEDASLMMVDAMLKSLGLEIDESNLDAPLKQVGDGIDARCFGIWDRSAEPDVLYDSDDESEVDDNDADSTPLSLELVLTSRDWIFIKECIAGGPLPSKGVSLENSKESRHISELIGRPDRYKEFLYDVISNRRSGLDVDKMDYLARDTFKAYGNNCIADLLPKLIGKAFVAWVECSNHSNCRTCRSAIKPGMHMTICYPEEMSQNLMSFFEQRYKEHQRIYTHTKTQRANYMICDILLLAEPHFRLFATDDGEDMMSSSPAGVKENPISRAMVDPETYLELTDSVLDKIMNTDNIELRPARILIKKLRSHKMYKRINTQIVGNEPWEQKLWDMSESDIVDEILKLSNEYGDALVRDDIIVDRNKIHHGMKDKNPVDSIRFVAKKSQRRLGNGPKNLPIATQIPDSSYRKPSFFLQKSVRIFCRSYDDAKRKHLIKCYEEFIKKLQTEVSSAGDDDQRYTNIHFEPISSSPCTPTRRSDDVPSITQSPNKYDESPPKSNKRQKLFNEVMERSNCD
ncbi:hypothetical protein ACHAXR_011891 [Thalassiosira sp. AJA248-18]